MKVVQHQADPAFQDRKPDDATKKDEKKPESRYRNILRKWDSSAGAHKDEIVGEATVRKPETKDIAYTFRRVYDPETGEKGAYSDLDIEDDGLIALLRSVIDSRYPGVNFDGDLVNMSAPFAPLVRTLMEIIHNYILANRLRFIIGTNSDRDRSRRRIHKLAKI